jgi:hypothetical protein
MSRRAVTLLVLLATRIAAAQQSEPPPLSEADQRALEKALAADAAADAAKQPEKPPSVPLPAPVQRALQSLNPDISAIIDFAGGYYSSDQIRRSGDDPTASGLNLQEVELALSATVDPYFRADLYLTVPNLEGLEVEEAYVTTLSLPLSLQLRAGVLRAAFGRQNTQHLHVQDFTRRPVLNEIFLGHDGLRAPAIELSWLAPTPFYLLFSVEALSVDPSLDPLGPLRTFGGGQRTELTYLANARTFVPFSDSLSLFAGLSFATGNTSVAPGDPRDDHTSLLYGADLYLKWKPPNVARTWMSLAWTTEFVLRQIPTLKQQIEGAIYSQIVWQIERRLYLGLRGEIDGLPAGPDVPREYAGALSFTFALSEFARVRLYGELRSLPGADLGGAAFVQLEASIGAHGAHPY